MRGKKSPRWWTNSWSLGSTDEMTSEMPFFSVVGECDAKHVRAGMTFPGSGWTSATHGLCDLEQVTSLL